MSGRRMLVALLLFASGCAGGGFEFKEALVIYRTPMGEAGKETLWFGFVNAAHPRYVRDGSPTEEIPGVKPVDEETAGECLDMLAGEGYPDDWSPAVGLKDALNSNPKFHVLVAEVDGRTRVLLRPGPSSDPETVKTLRKFVASKEALISTAGYSTGFRVVSNKAGASLFEDEREKLRLQGKEAGK